MKILIISDNQSNSLELKSKLETKYAIYIENSSIELDSFLNKNKIDTILCDYCLKHNNTFSLIKLINKNTNSFKSPHFIVFSKDPISPELESELFNEGAALTIDKNDIHILNLALSILDNVNTETIKICNKQTLDSNY